MVVAASHMLKFKLICGKILDQVSSMKLLVSKRIEESVLSLLANINLKFIRKSPKLTKKEEVSI